MRWVTIHEVTHAVQFGGAPWLREHLAGIIRELMDGMQLDVEKSGGLGLRDLLALGDGPAGQTWPRCEGRSRTCSPRHAAESCCGSPSARTAGRSIDRMQATMSLIEGHAEHVMDAVGAELLPSLPRLRSAMTRRRQMRPLPWRVLERLLGLELKLRQYEVGRRFCDTVVSEAGPAAPAPALAAPEGLPTSAELESPLSWLAPPPERARAQNPAKSDISIGGPLRTTRSTSPGRPTISSRTCPDFTPRLSDLTGQV